ncbi:tripartite tricarboxylate transporter TctB family protein [Brachybacterium sp. AOP3-A1-3]|uniref:tripartite tricarboxylate transporter TctB family protein n=1 Tax=Brachybacterium sp. AOP3-A1-3 TaxID=3457699 RepID=UPI00403480AB
MTTADTTSTTRAGRSNLVIGVASVAVGAVVIPYGASMPYIREGIPGPGLFPMMIGGLLILFGVLLVLTNVLAARRERRHRAELAAVAAGAGSAEDDPLSLASASVPDSGGDVPASELEAVAVLDTDIGSDGARRWINGAVLMGAIVFYVLFAEILGFPLTMAILVSAIVGSLRAKWWVAVTTGVLASLGLWSMFELALMVQLPDGIIQGF